MALTNIKDYIEQAKSEYDKHLKKNPTYSIPFEDEDLVYAIAEYYSMRGKFTDEEYLYLEKVWHFDQTDIKLIIGEED